MSEAPSASWRRQLARVALRTRRPRLEEDDRLPELPDRLLVRRARLRPLTRPAVVRDRVVAAPRRLGVPRHHLGLALDPLGELLPQHVDHPPVELLARALEQRLVRRLLHERVLERVRRLRRLAAHEYQLRLDETGQPPLQRPVVHVRHRFQQLVRELAPEHRGALRHLLRTRETVEPCQQRVLQRHRDLGERGIRPRFDDRLCQLLGEQRDAVGAGDELLHDGLRQRSCRAHCDNHLPRLPLGEAAQATTSASSSAPATGS